MKPCKATASSSAVRVRFLAQGHHDAQLGGAGDRTSNLPVTSDLSTLPPKLLLPTELVRTRHNGRKGFLTTVALNGKTWIGVNDLGPP